MAFARITVTFSGSCVVICSHVAEFCSVGCQWSPPYLRSQRYRKGHASFALEPCSVVWDVSSGVRHWYPIDEGRVLENKD